MLIACRDISICHEPFIIAEMSGNHNRSLGRALEIVNAAAKSGAHAIKLQTYTPDTMTLDLSEREFFISDENSPWKGRSLYDLYEEAHTPWAWHEPIFKRARELELIPFSTPFDETAVDFLETLDAPCYKIASFENTDIPLIRKAASTGKPMIISTGMATLAELAEAVSTAREHGASDVVLLKCTSSYPAPCGESNISTLPHMRTLFGCEAGVSDHTSGIGVAVASIALGGTVIEKHFTLDRGDGGVDAAFSLEPHEMAALVTESRRAWEAIGNVKYDPGESETGSRVYRRSLYIAGDMAAGETLTPKTLRRVRPGHGLSPRYYEVLLGKKLARDVQRGTPVSWDLFIVEGSHDG